MINVLELIQKSNLVYVDGKTIKDRNDKNTYRYNLEEYTRNEIQDILDNLNDYDIYYFSMEERVLKLISKK
jgi:hypothetical protein